MIIGFILGVVTTIVCLFIWACLLVNNRFKEDKRLDEELENFCKQYEEVNGKDENND